MQCMSLYGNSTSMEYYTPLVSIQEYYRIPVPTFNNEIRRPSVRVLTKRTTVMATVMTRKTAMITIKMQIVKRLRKRIKTRMRIHLK